MTNEPPVQVAFAAAFRQALKRLRRKYPHIQQDVQPLIDQLASGETPGDQIQGTGYAVYKTRVPNRDAQRGKSGGYRVIYYLRTVSHVILLIIYSKSERANVGTDEIQGIIADLPQTDDN